MKGDNILKFHQDCQEAFNLLSAVQVNELIDEFVNVDHAIHEHDDEASINSHNMMIAVMVVMLMLCMNIAN